MKVLIISGSFLPMSPSGAAYVAGAARRAGHEVEVFDCFLADDLIGDLKKKLAEFDPDVAGISITVVTNDSPDEQAEYYTKYFDMRPKIKSVVDTIKQNSNARIVPGGPGFNYFSREWLDYLDLDYGIRGEAEYSFPLFLERLEQGGDIFSVPGCAFKKSGEFHKIIRERITNLDGTGMPAYDLFASEKYFAKNILHSVCSKRGCAFQCIYCPYSSLEGSRYRLKSPARVVEEIRHIMKTTGATAIEFAENSFNRPRKHAEAICREIIDRGVEVNWRSGAIKPLGISKDFCKLMKESGCDYVGLSIESASAKMLANMKRGYRVSDVRESLDNLSESDIPFGLSIMLGAPGESPETIAETFRVVNQYPKVSRMWVSIGIYLWTHHQDILTEARKAGQLKDDRELFDGAYYISPELPKDYITDFIETLRPRDNCNFQVNKPYASYEKQVNDV